MVTLKMMNCRPHYVFQEGQLLGRNSLACPAVRHHCASILVRKLICAIIDDACDLLEHGLEDGEMHVSIWVKLRSQLVDFPTAVEHHSVKLWYTGDEKQGMEVQQS